MKTIRNQLKYPIVLDYQVLYKNEFRALCIHFFAVTKRTTNRQQTKNQIKLARKFFGSRKVILWPPKYVRLNFCRTPIMYYVAAH